MLFSHEPTQTHDNTQKQAEIHYDAERNLIDKFVLLQVQEGPPQRQPQQTQTDLIDILAFFIKPKKQKDTARTEKGELELDQKDPKTARKCVREKETHSWRVSQNLKLKDLLN